MRRQSRAGATAVKGGLVGLAIWAFSISIANGQTLSGALPGSFPIPVPGVTFTTTIAATSIPYGWRDKQVVVNSRILAVNSPVRYSNGGNNALQVTVQPGDNPISSTGERNEILNMITGGGALIPVNAGTGDEAYAISVNLPSGYVYPAGSNPFAIFLQLHSADLTPYAGLSPSVALDAGGMIPGEWALAYRGGDVGSFVSHYIDLGPLNLNQWEDFVLFIHWSATGGGSIIVYMRANESGPLIYMGIFTGANLYSSNGTVNNHYWKTGFYRSVFAQTNVLYESQVVRAPTIAAAALAAFGSYP